MYQSDYPINAVCADVCAVKHGHILVVTRADNGKYALPGGHVGLEETCREAGIRELFEETGLKIDPHREADAIAVFDSPNRSGPERARTISHAFYYRLDIWGKLPQVKGSDDATAAKWMSFAEFMESGGQFHDDHERIIRKFIEDLL